MEVKNTLVLITGGSASGKTMVARELKEAFGDKAVYLSQDNFYKPGGDEDRNYDVPEAFDFKTQRKVLKALLGGQEATLPVYDFAVHDVIDHVKLQPAKIIIFEGLFTLHDYKLTQLADFKIFVDTPADTRLARRLLRDVKERGRDTVEVISRWQKDVQPSYIEFISPMKQYADLILPWVKVRDRAIKAMVVSISNLHKSVEDIVKDI